MCNCNNENDRNLGQEKLEKALRESGINDFFVEKKIDTENSKAIVLIKGEKYVFFNSSQDDFFSVYTVKPTQNNQETHVRYEKLLKLPINNECKILNDFCKTIKEIYLIANNVDVEMKMESLDIFTYITEDEKVTPIVYAYLKLGVSGEGFCWHYRYLYNGILIKDPNVLIRDIKMDKIYTPLGKQFGEILTLEEIEYLRLLNY